MKKWVLAVLLVPAVLVMNGCATIMTGKYEDISVTSDPPGVTVRADNGTQIVTPGHFNFTRNQEHTLVADYGGAETQQVHLKHQMQGWVWGNILLGGIIGLAIDSASGAGDELFPKKVHFDFTSEGQQIARRKSRYLSAHPDLKPKFVFAVENGLAIKGMTKDALLASLGSPDEIDPINDNRERFIYIKPPHKTFSFTKGKLVNMKNTK